jgi:hypothetical protein
MGLFVAGGMGREVGGVISSLRYEYVVAVVKGVVGVGWAKELGDFQDWAQKYVNAP